MYADDSQLEISFRVEDSADSIKRIERCVADIDLWMVKNKLKLNGDKTEVLITGRHNIRSKAVIPPLSIGGDVTHPSSCVRDLGVMLDSGLTMSAQVSSICKAASFQL